VTFGIARAATDFFSKTKRERERERERRGRGRGGESLAEINEIWP